MWRCCSTCATFLPHPFWLRKNFQYFAPASNRLCSPSPWRARFRTALLRRCFSRAQVKTRNQIRSHSRGCCAPRSYAGRCVQPGTFPTCSGPYPASPRTKLLRLHHFSWTTCRHCRFFCWRTLWLRCCWHPHCGIRARAVRYTDWDDNWPMLDPGTGISSDGIAVTSFDIWAGGTIQSTLQRTLPNVTEVLLGKATAFSDKHTLAAAELAAGAAQIVGLPSPLELHQLDTAFQNLVLSGMGVRSTVERMSLLAAKRNGGMQIPGVVESLLAGSYSPSVWFNFSARASW